MKFNIKKTVTLAVAVAMLTGTVHTGIPQIERFSTVQTVYADTQKITVLVDGKQVDFSKYGKEPFIENGKTYVPLRSVFESFGATDVTATTKPSGTATNEFDANVYVFQKNVAGYDIEVDVNIKEKMMPFNSYYTAKYSKGDESALFDFAGNELILRDGRTFVPLRLLSEIFGYKVDWNGTNKVVSIDTSNPSSKGFDNIASKLDGTFDEKYGFKPSDVTTNNGANTTPTKETEPVVSVKEETKETKEEAVSTINVTAEDIQKANELMLEKVNALRKENGVAPLVLDDKLINLATMKAEDMVENNYYDHQSPIYGRANEMYQKIYGQSIGGWGENITKSSGTFGAKQTLSELTENSFYSWKNSKGHKENMLNPKFTKIGFGFKIAPTQNSKITVDPYSVMILQY